MLLRKTRDFGDKISDTVEYIRTHLKDLISLYLTFVVPMTLVALFLGANAISDYVAMIQSKSFQTDPMKLFSPMVMLTLLVYLMAGASYSTVTYLHMRMVDELPEKRTYFSDVASRFLPKFLSNLGYLVTVMILAIVSIVLAIIPILGPIALFFSWIFVFIVLSQMLPANTIEDRSYPSAIGRAFALMNGQWWSSFGFLFILFLIFYLFSMIINVSISAIWGVASISFFRTGPAQFTPRYFIITGIAGIIGQVFYLILHIGVGILFFSLREQKEGGGLESRIETLGGGGSRLPEEQY